MSYAEVSNISGLDVEQPFNALRSALAARTNVCGDVSCKTNDLEWEVSGRDASSLPLFAYLPFAAERSG